MRSAIICIDCTRRAEPLFKTGVTASFTITHDRVCARWIGGGRVRRHHRRRWHDAKRRDSKSGGFGLRQWNCDRQCRPDERPNDLCGRRCCISVRRESGAAYSSGKLYWRTIQARRTAQAICERPIATMEAPWFWSEQYDQMVLVAGLPQPGLSLLSFEDGARPLWRYGQHGDVTLVVGINRARDVRMAHRMLSRSIQ